MPSPALEGVFRSLRLYHGGPEQRAAMDALYRRFLGRGDLAFDIGAHVGDRISSFRRLGARVVACEPQPLAMRALRLIHGRDPEVTLVGAACGETEGTLRLHVNMANPTVSTGSSLFVADARAAAGWEGQTWDGTLDVRCTTLDRLIALHGAPAFVKIDVEGLEDAVLRGVSQPLRALSFEFTTIQRGVALRCLEGLETLGNYGFDLAIGESQQLAFGRFIPARDMATHLMALPHEANSGDVYCVHQP